MATILLSLSSKEDKITHRSEVLLRFLPFHGVNLRSKTGIFIYPRHFRYFVNRTASQKAGVVIPENITSITQQEADKRGYSIKTYGEIVISDRIVTPEVEFDKQQKKIIEQLQNAIIEAIDTASREDIDAMWLDKIISQFFHPTKQYSEKRVRAKGEKSIYDLAEEYLEKKRFSYDHTKAFKVLIRDLARYEAFKSKVLHERFKWNIHKITRYDIDDFEHYLRNEKSLSEQYPKQFEAILEKYPAEINVVHIHTKLQDRGDNTIIKLKKKFKAFMQWLYDNQLTTNRPFDGVKIGVEKYGVPFYLWKEERNIVAEADLHEEWKMLSDEDKKAITEKSLDSLSTQRDIFVFQCLVGCRVGDLERLTSRNITNGILEYVPSKTMDEDAPVKPRIPLNKTAISLVNKYKGTDEKGRLFPFISPDKYNEAIRKILLICGITRNVQVRNSTTGETEIKRICDVASSHMARRTFVGAAYKVVKDPNIVGKMSGHVEGSRAFNRYRQIDDDILRETINEI